MTRTLNELSESEKQKLIREYNAMKDFILQLQKDLTNCPDSVRARYEFFLENINKINGE